MKAKLTDSFNAHHNASDRLDGVNVVENWIIEDEQKDKSVLYGFNLSKGTLMQGIKIDNDSVWAKVKDGTFKGVSIEGIFDDFLVKASKSNQINKMDLKLKTAKNFIAKLMGEPTKLEASVNTDKGMLYTPADEFAEGVEVFTDAEGTNPASGDFVLENGQMITVTEGVLAAIMEKKPEGGEDLTAVEVATALQKVTQKFEARFVTLENENKELKIALSKIPVNGKKVNLSTDKIPNDAYAEAKEIIKKTFK